MKLGQLIKYTKEIFFFKNYTENLAETSSTPLRFSKQLNMR